MTNVRKEWNLSGYQEHADFVPVHGAPVVDLLRLHSKAGARVLDLGCGDGKLTSELIELGFDVVGADSSEALLKGARTRGIRTVLADGHDLRFDTEFDAVFSNAALHWMTEPEKVIDSVARALKRPGVFVVISAGTEMSRRFAPRCTRRRVPLATLASFQNSGSFLPSTNTRRCLSAQGFVSNTPN
ncbi:MAG: class I SAM-dependent methyltransferase [Polyangiales bacterium]